MVEEVVRQFNRRLTPRETKDLRVPGKMWNLHQEAPVEKLISFY